MKPQCPTLFLLALLACLSPIGARAENALTLRAVTLVTGQFEAMVAFYRDALGFELDRAEAGYARFRDTPLAIIDRQVMEAASEHEGFARTGPGQRFELAFELPSLAALDDFYADLEVHGARLVRAPRDEPWGQRVAYFADPDGNVHDVFAALDASRPD